MWPDRVSNPGPLTYESGALPTALRGPAENLRPGIACTTGSHLKLEARMAKFAFTDLQISLLLSQVCIFCVVGDEP